MQYSLMRWETPSVRKWRRMLRAFAWHPHDECEPYVRALLNAAPGANIRSMADLVELFTRVWQPGFQGRFLMDPMLDFHNPYDFGLRRHQWGVDIDCWLSGTPHKASLFFKIKGQELPKVEAFARGVVPRVLPEQGWNGNYALEKYDADTGIGETLAETISLLRDRSSRETQTT